MMDMSPHLEKSAVDAFGMSIQKRTKGITAQRNNEAYNRQKDPFWELAQPGYNTQAASRKLESIKVKFKSSINRITDQLVESAVHTELGVEVINENNQIRQNKSNLRGDLAIHHLNQNLIELEQLK